MTEARDYVIRIVIARTVVPSIVVSRIASSAFRWPACIRAQLHQSKRRYRSGKHVPMPAGADNRMDEIDRPMTSTTGDPTSYSVIKSDRAKSRNSTCDCCRRASF
jgi:hypothetical protein